MDGKVLGDLKVAELRGELEKRDLDKNGVKQVLIERLKEALISEGKDPAAYMFSSVVTVLPSAEVSLVDTEKSGVNAETQSIEPGPENTKAEEVASEECTIATKKETGDSDPYVVHIEEPEEDLDYDLKSECVVSKEAETYFDQGKVEKDADAKDSDSAVPQVKDLSNLRVSNLSKSTKAADLKQHFSAHGKVSHL
uniref:Scaffold attachment factor B2 n=1 Tax=Schistocephalus solidus TaxID=70667 RepID=A0A0X3PCR2_SCHSO